MPEKILKTYLQQKKYILSCHQISKQNYDMTQNQTHAIILQTKTGFNLFNLYNFDISKMNHY